MSAVSAHCRGCAPVFQRRQSFPQYLGTCASGTLRKSFRADKRDNVLVCRVAVPQDDEMMRTTSSEVSDVQSQLEQAAAFGDIDTCIYLLNHEKYRYNITLDSKLLKKVVNTCYARGTPEKGLAIICSLTKQSPKHFSIILKECLTRGDVKMLDKVLYEREKAGYRPDVYSHSARISALGVAKQPVAALAQLHTALQDPSCDRIELYNAAISACERSQDWGGAEYVWNLVKKSHVVKPDIVTYNAMIKVTGARNDFEYVKKLYEDIKSSGLKPTSWTYTAVFSAAANCRAAASADWLIEVYTGMHLQPNDYILSSFFSAMSHTTSSRDQIDVVFELLQNSRSQGALNDVTYTSFMTFLARQDMPDRAVDVWDAARQDEILLSPHFFSSLFSACAKESSSEALYNMAFDAFDEFSSWYLDQDPKRMPKHVERDSLAAYNAFLHFLGEHKQLDIASLIFESMKSNGPFPDIVTYNTMLHITGCSKNVDAALDLYWEMTSNNIQATERTFGSLLHTFATVGNADAAKKIFDSLADSNIAPNSILYTSFIHAAVRHGDQKSLMLAFSLANEMNTRHVPLTDVTYGCLLVACEKQGDVAKAFTLYQKACTEGVTPSDQMHNILISVCTRCGKLDEALDLVKSMARKNSNIQQHAMNSLTRALSVESPTRAYRMISLMQAMNMQPSRSTRLEVLKQCAMAGDVVEALGMYRALRSNNIELDGPSGSALIECLCSAQNVDDAVEVYDRMMAMAWRGSNGTGRSPLPKRAHEPNGAALASLAHVHASQRLMQQSWKYYLQLRRKTKSLERATLGHRRMFEALIEGYCRDKNLKRALTVFDDWKAASSRVTTFSSSPQIPLKQHPRLYSGTGEATTSKKQPKLSYLALAYLEASCNSDPEHAWRVYDVLAVMRAQKEYKRQSQLAHPEKASHHVSYQ
ncbi:Pentatricopeptide repeat-containing protein [Picochlorum sp. SENEW3]|nr:Pentatricopeptide repeat-containing protein [Picochlorum sp. SENEW3]